MAAIGDNMNKHTRGPWGPITDEFGNCERGIEYLDGRDHYLAVVQCGDPDELLANARLIAAAPAMLLALQELIAEREAYNATGGILLALDAVALATGGAA